jgi:hypothetical protein
MGIKNEEFYADLEAVEKVAKHSPVWEAPFSQKSQNRCTLIYMLESTLDAKH